jgi:dihydrofolate reductase
MSSASPPVRICLIAAMSENRVIGRGNKLPWKIPEDMKYFMTMTLGRPVIMGRKTFESIKKPLPGRTNIVVSRDFSAPGITVVRSLPEAVAEAKKIAARDRQKEIMIAGGGQIYEQALPFADRIYLTVIHRQIADGDAFFPAYDQKDWKETARTDRDGYSFLTLERASSTPPQGRGGRGAD